MCRSLLCALLLRPVRRNLKRTRRTGRDGSADAWAHVREDVCDAVDMFIAPSRYLLQTLQRRVRHSLSDKITYLDYGFHRATCAGPYSKTG